MNQRLMDVLGGNEDNYIYSFVEVHPDMTKQDMDRRLEELYQAGVQSVVFEYGNGLGNGFAGFTPEWFELLKAMIPRMKRYGMTFLIQDASPFPTGAANGWFSRKPYRESRKLYLAEGHMDVKGPRKNCCFLAEDFLNDKIYQLIPDPGLEREDVLKYVIAIKKDENGLLLPESAVDLTGFVDEGMLVWDVPEGEYRLFFVFTTRNGGSPDYMNLLDARSVRVLIDSVYEYHYKEIGQEAGKTWLGFFYDEPEIGNLSHHDFHALPGKRFMSMPWSDEMPGLLSAVLGKDYPRFLPLLWYDGSAAAKEIAGSVRYEYMNLITRLIENNYSRQMHLWCREHGLMYIGHVLEDENSHGRLGCGCGHFFRVEHYQDMAGVDVISEQIIPGATGVNAVNGCSWIADGEFYHYGLAKLASSNAHINPLMKDQSFCEILALYGMTAGPKLRKYIVDHMVVAGINHFIVMQGSFPGNPYFPFGGEIYSPYYIMLHHYTNRLCHLMSGGRRQIPAAILYHGEAEWSGEAMLFQKAARVLAENQLDYDIISGDYLMSGVVESGCIHVNDAVFRLLIVPGASRLPEKIMEKMKALSEDGALIWFLDQCPTDYSDYGCTMETAFDGQVVLLDALEKTLHEHPCLFDISLTEKCNALRYCLTVHDDMECLMLHNQEAFLPMSPQILLPERWNDPQQVILADLAGQKLERPGERMRRLPSGRLVFRADLGQWESAVLIYGGDLSGMDVPPAYKVMDRLTLENCWHLSFKPYIDDGENVYKDLVLDHPSDLAGLKDYRKFAGEITYTTEFDIQLPQGCQKVSLSVNDVYESVTVIFNGHLIGRAFAEKYRFHLPSDYFLEHNILALKVQNSMARGVNDGFIKSSKYMPLEPSGLTGNVTLLFEEEWEES